MPYVRRQTDGSIESLHRNPVDGTAAGAAPPEFLPDEHPEVQAFIGRPVDAAGADAGSPAAPAAGNAAASSDFSRLDADFVRVLEDVIDALISRHVFNITDLPPEAQAKLFARKSFRERSAKHALHLFEPSNFGDVV